MLGGHDYEEHHHHEEDVVLLEMTQKTFETELEKFGEDDQLESSSRSVKDAAMGEDDPFLHNHTNKRKRYHRHTQLQIQEMEA